MAAGRSLCLAGILVIAAAPVEDVDSLSKKYANRVDVAWSKAGSDAARERAREEVADEYRARAWKLVRRQRRAEDVDAAWRFALSVDQDAGAEDLVEHARSYLAELPDGAHRAYAAHIIASAELAAAEGEVEEDRVLDAYDTGYQASVLERGQLRTAAADRALRRGDLERARHLYEAALALPKSEAELAQEERNGGSSWHVWWQDTYGGLALFEKDWSDTGAVDMEGDAWTVSDYRGKVLLIDFWASW